MRRALGVLAAATLVGACSGGHGGASLKPHPLPGSATSVIDYTGVSLPHVPGTTTTSIVEVGTATITGAVSGPAGLVPGATVHIEHLVGTSVIPHDVQTGPDGRYSLPNVPGGRYRVRAFLAPALAQTTPSVQFIDDGQSTTFDLTMQDQRKLVARAAVAPANPFLGDAVTLAAVVANQVVDPTGIVRSVPLPFVRVELSGLGAYQLQQSGGTSQPGDSTTTTSFSFEPPTVAVTDGQGQVSYQLQCVSSAQPSLELLVTVTVTPDTVPGAPPAQGTQTTQTTQPAPPTQQVEHLPLTVPACIDPSTSTSPPTTRGGTTTTTRNPGSGTR
jgi:hypothetical protein